MSRATNVDTQPPALDADRHDMIRVHRARVNNLKDISVAIPKRRLTVFTGVSGLGQEFARVRHDRRRVTAVDQRDVQRVRAGLHADDGPARCRRAGGTDDGDPRRPGADGRQPPVDRRHGHGCQRHAADRLQPPRQAVHRLAAGVLVQHRDHQRRRGGDVREGRQEDSARSVRSRAPAACAPGARAWVRSPTSTCPSSTTTASRSTRVRSRSPGTAWRAGTGGSSVAAATSTRTSRSASSPRRNSTTCSTGSPPRSRSTASI